MIKEKGYRYSVVLSKEVDYLISSDDKPSQKVKLATQYGVSIRDASFLAKLLDTDDVEAQ